MISYRDVDDGVDLANGTEYGLGGAVFGADDCRAVAVAERLHTGLVRVNGNRLDLAA